MTTCRTTLTTVLVVAMLLVAGCGSTGPSPAVGPPTVVFADEDSCRTATGTPACGFVMYDFIPEGKTLDETCGVNFQEGVQVTSPDPDDTTTRFLADQLATCAIACVTRDGEVERERWVRVDGITMTVTGSDPDVESALATAVDACGTVTDR